MLSFCDVVAFISCLEREKEEGRCFMERPSRGC